MLTRAVTIAVLDNRSVLLWISITFRTEKTDKNSETSRYANSSRWPVKSLHYTCGAAWWRIDLQRYGSLHQRRQNRKSEVCHYETAPVKHLSRIGASEF